jgi:hypothetical protein
MVRTAGCTVTTDVKQSKHVPFAGQGQPNILGKQVYNFVDIARDSEWLVIGR